MNRRAFTLIELILVMAIIAIIVGMAVPNLHGFARGRRAAECADQIVALTRYARTQSITEGVPYHMNVNPADGTYWLTRQQDDGQFVPLSNSLGLKFQIPDGTRLSWTAPGHQDGQYILFQPNGRVEQGEIQLMDKDGQTFVIGCLSATEMYKLLTLDEQRILQQPQ